MSRHTYPQSSKRLPRMASELSAGNFKSAGTLTKVVEMEKAATSVRGAALR